MLREKVLEGAGKRAEQCGQCCKPGDQAEQCCQARDQPEQRRDRKSRKSDNVAKQELEWNHVTRN